MFGDIRCVGVIETSGTQDYVFAANRQAEAIGASGLIVNVTKDVLDAHAPSGVVPIVSSSGLLVFGAPEPGPIFETIRLVTDEAWERAPGLDIAGGFHCSDEAPSSAEDAQQLLRAAFRSVKEEQARRPSPALRFPVNPLTEVCETGLGPAVEIISAGGSTRTLGTQALAKHRARNDSWKRIGDAMHPATLARNVDAFDEPRNRDDDRWMAVVHADGNGVGTVIQDFLRHAGIQGGTAADFWDQYAKFSRLLESITTEALIAATRKVERRSGGLLFPILVGGDDVTVILPGEVSLEFTEALIIEFAKRAAQDPVTGDKRPLTAPLSLSSGIAITKPHYPFHASYELAGQLIDQAKGAPTPEGQTSRLPAFDFHMLFDAAPSTLERLRRRLEVALPGSVYGSPRVRKLTAKPMTLDDYRKTRELVAKLRELSMSVLNQLKQAVLLPGDPEPYFAIARERSSEPVPSYAETLVQGSPPDTEVTRLLDALEIMRLEK